MNSSVGGVIMYAIGLTGLFKIRHPDPKEHNRHKVVIVWLASICLLPSHLLQNTNEDMLHVATRARLEHTLHELHRVGLARQEARSAIMARRRLGHFP